MQCSNEKCSSEFDIELDQLAKTSNGSSGNHTTSYSYSGNVICPECGCEHWVEFVTDELDDTGEVLSIEAV